MKIQAAYNDLTPMSSLDMPHLELYNFTWFLIL